MSYNTKAIITDVNNKPVPQYYNPATDNYEAAQGSNGAINTQLTGSNATDAQSGFVPGMGYNGATFDRWRNNTQGTLLASA
ncbi:hypothetical protein ACI5FR_21615, partial [Paenibacillus sp. HJGM_3]